MAFMTLTDDQWILFKIW